MLGTACRAQETSQFRRAAVSIPANIAEGFKKTGKLDKFRFMNIAQGSLEECRYYLILARDLKYSKTSDLMSQVEEVPFRKPITVHLEGASDMVG